MPNPIKNEPIAEEVITLRCGRNLAYCEYGSKDGEPILFFSGAGFGRRYVPTPFPNHLEELSVRFITVDRPGTPHLAAVCAFAPRRVVAAALVCPVAPIVGDPPVDRPHENWTRGFARFCLLHLGGVLDRLFGAVFRKWQADPTTYVRDTMKQIVAEKDVAYMKEHPEFFQVQYAAAFGDAVHAPNGVPAMLEDMFHLNSAPWGFAYSELGKSKTDTFPVQAWWGGADDTAPHGKWICEQIGVEGQCVEDAGHGLIHNEFEPIIKSLLQGGS